MKYKPGASQRGSLGTVRQSVPPWLRASTAHSTGGPRIDRPGKGAGGRSYPKSVHSGDYAGIMNKAERRKVGGPVLSPGRTVVGNRTALRAATMLGIVDAMQRNPRDAHGMVGTGLAKNRGLQMAAYNVGYGRGATHNAVRSGMRLWHDVRRPEAYMVRHKDNPRYGRGKSRKTFAGQLKGMRQGAQSGHAPLRASLHGYTRAHVGSPASGRSNSGSINIGSFKTRRGMYIKVGGIFMGSKGSSKGRR